jgi:hypothetical protein
LKWLAVRTLRFSPPLIVRRSRTSSKDFWTRETKTLASLPASLSFSPGYICLEVKEFSMLDAGWEMIHLKSRK